MASKIFVARREIETGTKHKPPVIRRDIAPDLRDNMSKNTSGLSKAGSQLLKDAIALASRSENKSVELAISLARMQRADRSLLAEFIRTRKVSSRTAYLLAEVGRHVVELEVPYELLNMVGWTKLQLIARHLTPQNASDFLAFAATHSAPELKRKLAGAEESALHCVQLYFTREEYQVFEQTVLANGGKKVRRGLSGKEKALISALQVGKS